MKLSKKERSELVRVIVQDLIEEDNKTLSELDVTNRRQQLESLGDNELIETYAECVGCTICDHCGHVEETGACFYCKGECK